MKTINTIAGKSYVVTSPNGGTVTDSTGSLTATIAAGEQRIVWATDEALSLSDDNGKIIATFKGAPLVLGQPSGGGSSELLPGFTRLEYLESTGAQSIVTDCYISSASGVEIALDCELLNGGYTEPVLCGVVPPIDEGTPWGLGLYHSGGVANFSLFGTKNFFYGKTIVVNTRNTFVMQGASTLLINGVKEELVGYGGWSPSLKWNTAKPLTLFSTAKPDAGYALAGIKAKMFKTTISVGGTIEREFLPALDPAGEPCLFDIVSKQAFKNSGSGRFTAGVASVGALSNILLALPYKEAAGSKLHVRLPDSANMAEAQRIADLAGDLKNWQITFAS